MINIEKTLLSGQCFRWKKIDNNFDGVIGNKHYILPCEIEIKDPILRNYFDCNTDYEKIKNEIRKISPELKYSVDTIGDLFILNQDPWEVIISFITSQNNNIKRISKLIEKISNVYGKKIDEERNMFPTVKELENVTEEDLRNLGFGFRARYIVSAINYFKEVDFDEFKKLSREEMEKELLSIVGIGPKVANCILLYGFHFTNSFPIDVWMKKALSTTFKNLDIDSLGTNAGLIQQYIFEYMRLKNE